MFGHMTESNQPLESPENRQRQTTGKFQWNYASQNTAQNFITSYEFINFPWTLKFFTDIQHNIISKVQHRHLPCEGAYWIPQEYLQWIVRIWAGLGLDSLTFSIFLFHFRPFKSLSVNYAFLWLWATEMSNMEWNGITWLALHKLMANTVCIMMCSFSPSFDWSREVQTRYSLPCKMFLSSSKLGVGLCLRQLFVD